MTLAEFVEILDPDAPVTIAVCVDDHIYSPISDEVETVTTTLFAFVPTLLEAASFLAEDFCNAKIISIKFTENNTIQIWLDNADEYSLCE